MIKSISVLKELKKDAQGREVENRVVMPPALLAKIIKTRPSLKIQVEIGAGNKIGIADTEYEKLGAKMVSHQEALKADLILGVKETQPDDFDLLGQSIFMSYQHFAASRERTQKALEVSKKAGTTFLCFETMETQKDGRPFFPCLAPMSIAAGQVVVRHADMFALISQKTISRGALRATVLGAGNAGRTAAKEFSARGFEVHLIDRPNLAKLPKCIEGSFCVVSSMYTAGRSPQKLITKELLNTMMPGGCVYPIDIDQGGGIEGAMVTSLFDLWDLPKIEGTEVYCFAPPNLPSLGARTTSEALGSAILPYVIEIVKDGLEKAAKKNPTIALGINIAGGQIKHAGLENVV